jgi:mannose-6-phosphate isomerase-like protein (cupin superfamily)
MKTETLAFRTDFRVVFDGNGAQAAEMVIPPGDAEGGPANRHQGADQWLYVVSGKSEARVEGTTVPLAPAILLLIERGERHEVRNTGTEPLRTLNIYAPLAYDRQGEELPAGKD